MLISFWIISTFLPDTLTLCSPTPASSISLRSSLGYSAGDSCLLLDFFFYGECSIISPQPSSTTGYFGLRFSFTLIIDEFFLYAGAMGYALG